MTQLGFYFDMTRCSGCRCCQTACKDVKDLETGVLFRHVDDYDGGTFPDVWAASLSLACNHCEQPQCIAVCPVVAISKDEGTGLVIQDQKMCIICERCVRHCPYEAPKYVPSLMLVGKCDGCIDFVARGEPPACVAACSTRCLRFGELDELRQTYGELGGVALTSDLAVLPDSSETRPSLLIATKPQMLATQDDQVAEAT
jgi:anaerobic dimethyl sulfoxide reductase subunit B (iron-sulfur subunit)